MPKFMIPVLVCLQLGLTACSSYNTYTSEGSEVEIGDDSGVVIGSVKVPPDQVEIGTLNAGTVIGYFHQYDPDSLLFLDDGGAFALIRRLLEHLGPGRSCP